jgi:hypothetical protein
MQGRADARETRKHELTEPWLAAPIKRARPSKSAKAAGRALAGGLGMLVLLALLGIVFRHRTGGLSMPVLPEKYCNRSAQPEARYGEHCHWSA